MSAKQLPDRILQLSLSSAILAVSTFTICTIASSAQPIQINVGNTRVPNVEESLKAYGIGLSEEDLVAALKNPKANVRVLAAQELAFKKDQDAAPSIHNALSLESSGVNRVNMALALAQLGDQNGLDLLKETCSDEKMPAPLRIQAAQNMLLFGSKDCLPQVLSIAQNADASEVNKQVALSLLPQYFADGKGVPKEVLTLISERLTDKSPIVRLEAAIVLGQLDASRQTPALESAIAQEPEPLIRHQMEQVLETLKDKPPKQE